MNKILVIILVVATVVVAVWFMMDRKDGASPDTAVQLENATTATYSDGNGGSITVAYAGEQAQIINGLGLENVLLTQVVAASGAKYESADGTVVVWNNGSEVTIYQNDAAVFTGKEAEPGVTYTSVTGDTLAVEYINETARVNGMGLSDLTLDRAVSDSGARYTNGDESIVLWNNGNEVTLYENNEPVFTGVTEMDGVSAVDPVLATLTANQWLWYQTVMSDGERTEPADTEAFVVTYNSDGSMTGTTDCNSFSGAYMLTGNQMVVGPLAMTRKFCEDSQEQEFVGMISGTTTVFFTIEGGLTLLLPMDSGSVMFKKQAAPLNQTLAGTWVWQSAEVAGETVTPQSSDAFTLTFTVDNKVNGTTDCNNFSGAYSLEGTTLEIGPVAATLMACEGSQEQTFTSLVTEESSLAIDGNTLTLTQAGGDTVTFMKK